MGLLRVLAVAAALAAGCSFDGAGTSGDGAPPWWDANFSHRQRLAVTTGPLAPDKGYSGYTARLTDFDTGALVAAMRLQPSCADLRLAFWDGGSWTEAPMHIDGCDSAATALAFALPIDLADNETFRDVYLYYGNATAGPGPAVTTDNVFLWWDDALVNRNGDYDHGRMDAWLGTGHEDSMAHDSAGYYIYGTGDDSQSGYRRAVDERDVLVEAEFFHTGCWPNNMQTGVCVRGIIASGSGATESSDHYYCTTRGQNPDCNDNDQGLYDGDIIERDNEDVAVQGIVDPPPIATNQWRKQALAAYATNPTQLRFWDSDGGWAGLGFPEAGSISATGADADDYEGRGFAAVMTSQDAARIRDIVVRRYVEPEPAVSLEGSATANP